MTMVQSNGSVAQLRRVNPYPGLMIDADVWRDAHEYHRDVVRLHHLALHGWGIVHGLEVSLASGADNLLSITPGIAIDPAGNFILVDQPQTYRPELGEAGTVYVVLKFSEVLGAPATNGAGRGQPTRVVERYQLKDGYRPPTDAYVELVRVEFDPVLGRIREPRDSAAPGTNELDRRGRVQVGSTTVPAALRLPPALPMTVEATPAPVSAEQLQRLSTQLESLAVRVDELGRLSPSATPPSVEATAAPANDVLELGRQVEQVTAELRRLAEQVAGLSGAPAAVSAAPSPVFDALAQRVHSLAQDLESLGFQVQAVAARQAEAPQPSSLPADEPRRTRLRLGLVDHGAAGWDQHRYGLALLAREVSSASDLEVVLADQPVSAAGMDQVDAVYLCGVSTVSLDDAQLAAMRALLDRGGVVVGEACAAGPAGADGAKEFFNSFVDLSASLGRPLTRRIDREHPLLTARSIFGEPPLGAAGSSRVTESGGLVCTDADYGCAWQGGPPDRPLPRAAIREAVEFGANLVGYRRR